MKQNESDSVYFIQYSVVQNTIKYAIQKRSLVPSVSGPRKDDISTQMALDKGISAERLSKLGTLSSNNFRDSVVIIEFCIEIESIFSR